MSMHSTKISGLAVDTEYTFHLVLRTSAGTFHSERVAVRTHKMTDLSGVTITTGILSAAVREHLTQAVERIGAKIVDGVRIDTTHFVTTEGRGQAWEKAVEQNIPVVRPEWVDACEKNGRILGVTKFYLDAMRPGPQVEEAPTPVTPQSAAPQVPPAAPPASVPGATEEEEQKPEVPKKDNAEAPGSSESEEDEEEPEQKAIAESEPKARAPEEEEQKVRLEDKEGHQVPLRPKEDDKDKEESADEEDEEDSDEGKDEQGGKKLATAHDGSSFQEVAL